MTYITVWSLTYQLNVLSLMKSIGIFIHPSIDNAKNLIWRLILLTLTTHDRVKWNYGNHIATASRQRVKNLFKLPHNIIFSFRISLCTWTPLLIRFHCNCVYTTAASYLIFTKFDCKDVKALTGQQILAHCPKYKALAYLIEMNDFLDI